MVEDIVTYASADHAGRHRSTAGTRDVAPHLEEAAADLARDGFTILPELFHTDEVDQMRTAVEPLFPYDGGRNDFEGRATRRLYAVAQRTDVFDPYVEHPDVLALLDRFLLPNHLLSMLQVIDIRPGESAQALHPDDGFYPVPRPRAPLSVATILAIDDFTPENGATLVVPGSHLLGDEVLRHGEVATVPAVMPAGSVLVFVGTLWHGGGANRTGTSRMCATAQYCEPWLRTQENMSLAVSRERAAGSSDTMQRLLGYSIHPPFIGQVDGMHPKRVLG